VYFAVGFIVMVMLDRLAGGQYLGILLSILPGVLEIVQILQHSRPMGEKTDRKQNGGESIHARKISSSCEL